MEVLKAHTMDYGSPIQGASPDLTGDGACQGRTGQSSLGRGEPDGAASGSTRQQKPENENLVEVSVCVQHAIGKLKSLYGGYRGLIEVVTCGNTAIPALRALLFEREPSGLYQSRCLAVRALSALKAYDMLVDYLRG
ncbi:MAG: hypothetical protein ACLP4V_11645 [Methylocella sp.]